MTTINQGQTLYLREFGTPIERDQRVIGGKGGDKDRHSLTDLIGI